MSMNLKDALATVDSINAKSTRAEKNGQIKLVSYIRDKLSATSDVGSMYIAQPCSLQVVTDAGIMSRRSFIGGEEVIFKGIRIVPRSYKVIVEFSLVRSSDARGVSIINVPLSGSLDIVMGLELAMDMGDISAVIASGFSEIKARKTAATTPAKNEMHSDHYDSIGYGSW